MNMNGQILDCGLELGFFGIIFCSEDNLMYSFRDCDKIRLSSDAGGIVMMDNRLAVELHFKINATPVNASDVSIIWNEIEYQTESKVCRFSFRHSDAECHFTFAFITFDLIGIQVLQLLEGR